MTSRQSMCSPESSSFLSKRLPDEMLSTYFSWLSTLCGFSIYSFNFTFSLQRVLYSRWTFRLFVPKLRTPRVMIQNENDKSSRESWFNVAFVHWKLAPLQYMRWQKLGFVFFAIWNLLSEFSRLFRKILFQILCHSRNERY